MWLRGGERISFPLYTYICTLIYFYRLSTGNTTKKKNIEFYELIFRVRKSHNYYGFNETTVDKSEKGKGAFRQKDFDFEASLANIRDILSQPNKEGDFLLQGLEKNCSSHPSSRKLFFSRVSGYYRKQQQIKMQTYRAQSQRKHLQHKLQTNGSGITQKSGQKVHKSCEAVSPRNVRSCIGSLTNMAA